MITLLLQWRTKCSSCCEFLVSSLHFVLSSFVLAGVFEDLLKVVFFLLYVWNLLASLSVWVFKVSCGACRGVMLRVLAAVVSCSWRRFLVNWWGEALSEDSSALDHSFLWSLQYYEGKSRLWVCMRAYYCTTTPPQPLDSPMTSFKLPSANILILTYLHPLLSFLSSHFVYFRPPSLRPPCGSSALQECLHSSNPLINSLLSQSHLILFTHFPFFPAHPPIFPNLT